MDSLQREFDVARAQFQSLDTLRLVEDTLESEWRRGRDTYLAFLVLIDNPDAVSHLRRLVREVEDIPGVDPYPEDYWHLTIKGIGFETEEPTQPEEVTGDDIARISEAARDVLAQQSAFDLTVGPANAFPEVVFAEVWDSMPIRELNTRLLDALPDLVRYSFDGEVFLPHVSIARFTSDEGLDVLKQRLSAVRRDNAGPRLPVGEVQLVRAHLSAAAPRLETIETYRLPAP
jgi:2'-5' RNA ligase